MVSKAFSFPRSHFIGFDHIWNDIARLSEMSDNKLYPPHNVVKQDDTHFSVELALAGYSKKDIDISLEEGVLTIKSVKSEKEKEVEDNNGVLHQGIAKRYFSKAFTIADDVKVNGAELKDGLLKVSMERIVPEHKKARTIDIK